MNPTEPSASKRSAAHELREIYIALTSEGFSPQEALTLIGHIMIAQTGGQQ